MFSIKNLHKINLHIKEYVSYLKKIYRAISRAIERIELKIGNSISYIDDLILDEGRARWIFKIGIRFLLLLLKINNRRKRTVLYAAQTTKSWSKEKEKQTKARGRKKERESSFSRAIRKFCRFSEAWKTFREEKSKCLIGNTGNITDEYCPPHFKERISIYRRKVLLSTAHRGLDCCLTFGKERRNGICFLLSNRL